MACKDIPLDNGVQEGDPLLPAGSWETSGLFFGRGLCDWLAELRDDFGYKLLALLFVTQHVLKGFVDHFKNRSHPFLYRAHGVDAARMEILTSVTQLPWAMKPCIGLLSDMCPLRGFKKSPYMVASSFLGIAAYLIVGLTPRAATSVGVVVACNFAQSLQSSTCDLLSEAHYAEHIRAKPERSSNLVSFVWSGLCAAGIGASLVCGPVIQLWGPEMVSLLCVMPASAVLFVVAPGFLEEKQMSADEQASSRGVLGEQPEMCALCLLVLVGTLCIGISGVVLESKTVNFALTFCVAIVVLLGFSVVLSPVVAKFNVFNLLQTSFHLKYHSGMFYFFTDGPEQYPEGPHFSELFYVSVLGTTGSVFSLVGIWSYQRHMRAWTYRRLIVLANVAVCVLHLLDLLLLTRVNVKLGIPDKAFVLGSQPWQHVIWQWEWMPQVLLLAQLCPKGREAIMYSLLAGCHNLGNCVSASGGALLMELLSCKPDGSPGESAQFENLWLVALLSTVTPLVPIVLLFWLIPDAPQSIPLLGDEETAVSESLLRRWLLQEQPTVAETTPGGAE